MSVPVLSPELLFLRARRAFPGRPSFAELCDSGGRAGLGLCSSWQGGRNPRFQTGIYASQVVCGVCGPCGENVRVLSQLWAPLSSLGGPSSFHPQRKLDVLVKSPGG